MSDQIDSRQINPAGFPPLPPDNRGIQARVTPPAIALIVTGCLGIVTQLLFLVLGLTGSFMQGFQEGLSEGMESPEFIAPFLGSAFTVISGIIGIIIAAVIIYAGIRMLKLQSWGFAIAASILAMIPCVSPCCIIGLPVGIWALVILNDNDVKMAFN